MTYEHLTIMYSLPRSMTQWWAWFFGQEISSMHDPLARYRSPKDFAKTIPNDRRIFIADTSAIFFHDQLRTHLPGHRRLYMFRKTDDVCQSLLRQTGQRWEKLMYEQQALMMKHAYGPLISRRLHFGSITLFTLQNLSYVVTGRQYGGYGELAHKVDVPLHRQYRNDANVRSLMAYKESL